MIIGASPVTIALRLGAFKQYYSGLLLVKGAEKGTFLSD